MGWNYLSITNLQRLELLKAVNGEVISPHSLRVYGYLSMLGWKILNVSKIGPMKHTVPTIIITARHINNVHIAMARHRPATGAADSRINGMVVPSISRMASAICPKWPGITRRTMLHRSWETRLTHWGRDKMADIFKTFSNTFSWM